MFCICDFKSVTIMRLLLSGFCVSHWCFDRAAEVVFYIYFTQSIYFSNSPSQNIWNVTGKQEQLGLCLAE